MLSSRNTTLLAIALACSASAASVQAATPESEKAARDTKVQAKTAGSESDGSKGVVTTQDPAQKATAKKTADTVNQVPGVNVSQKDLEPPAQKHVKGFHPIKKLLEPVENLEGMAIKLEQQLMKLEGPIAALHPPMTSLNNKMSTVDEHMTNMQGQLTGMSRDVDGVRSDIASMRKDIQALKGPIISLSKPIANVQTPLESLERQLNYILAAIVIMAVGIVVGTPFAAVMVYKHRNKFLHPKDRAAKSADSVPKDDLAATSAK